MLLDYNFPRIGKECNKNLNWRQGQLTLTQKQEENIPKSYSCIRAPTFSTHMPQLFIIKICFTNKVNTICGGGQLLVSGPQGPGCQRPMSQSRKSRVPGPRGLKSWVPVLGTQVSGPDFRLSLWGIPLRCYLFRKIIDKKIFL